MEEKIKILAPFFEEPRREFHIRELARFLKKNHTSVRQHLNKLVKEGYLEKKEERGYSLYKLIIDKKSFNLKLYYNLEKLRNSKIIDKMEKEFEYPVVVLFGSFSRAVDDEKSDIDLFVLTETEKKFNTEKYEKILNRKISFHIFNKKQFVELKKKNPEFINSICNGIILSGKLEVL